MLRVLVRPVWLLRHALLVVALVTCWELGSWQLHRALERHSVLNWSYTVEWGLFGAFALLCWGWFLRDELRGEPDGPEAPPAPAYHPVAQPVAEDEDPELAAYNRYLAELNERAT